MNTSSRVPGVSRNSGWQVIDAMIAARRLHEQPNETVCASPQGVREAPCSAGPSGFGRALPAV